MIGLAPREGTSTWDCKLPPFWQIEKGWIYMNGPPVVEPVDNIEQADNEPDLPTP